VADNFGLKIGIEGEKEFKNAIREINQSFKVLGSEMNLSSPIVAMPLIPPLLHILLPHRWHSGDSRYRLRARYTAGL
jgi:hypothetical protein